MVYGVILEEGEKYFTDMKKVFRAIGDVQLNYNWLITNAETVSTQFFDDADYFHTDYRWLSGDKLTERINTGEYYQWIWGVFSGFAKDVPEDEVIEYPLPFADCNGKLWEYPLKLQHRLAEIEIISFDASCMLLLAKDKRIIDRFKEAYPMCEDLLEYNIEYQKWLAEYNKERREKLEVKEV